MEAMTRLEVSSVKETQGQWRIRGWNVSLPNLETRKQLGHAKLTSKSRLALPIENFPIGLDPRRDGETVEFGVHPEHHDPDLPEDGFVGELGVPGVGAFGLEAAPVDEPEEVAKGPFRRG
jgi:hypothetical protein